MIVCKGGEGGEAAAAVSKPALFTNAFFRAIRLVHLMSFLVGAHPDTPIYCDE